MSQREKLLKAIRNNPADVRFEDAVKAADWYGFISRSGGNHSAVCTRAGFEQQLNFQRRKDGKAKKYQVEQLIAAMDAVDAGRTSREPGSE